MHVHITVKESAATRCLKHEAEDIKATVSQYAPGYKPVYKYAGGGPVKYQHTHT